MSYTYEYPRPAFTVDSMVFRRNAMQGYDLLLIQRKHEPFQGKWAFPGGFVDMDETAEDAVVRELEEETGLSGIPLEQLRTFSGLDRDPRGRTVSVVFYGFTDQTNDHVAAHDDAADARWFPLDDLPELAFDHRKIIEHAAGALKLNTGPGAPGL